uniref:FtsX-like permease family protein n=1 Tax=Anaerococcus mediterraneensis TaxID=1870984 RepID=UPI0009301C7B|nr:FtsX-like permease family protein [Anaerococcus mediterraneensis]
MNKTYIKNILRDIKKTKGKVFSIGVMVGLATMVIVALVITGPSMRKSLDDSLNTYKHPDIIVRSTYPMDFEDKILLEKDKDIDQISFIKTIDLMDEEKIIRLKSYDNSFEKSFITDGNPIKTDKEIILDESLKKYYKLGDTLDLSYINEDQKENSKLNNTSYKIVGFYKSSEKFMEDMKDLSPVGKKELDGFAFIDKKNFTADKFNEVNISYKDSDQMDKTSDDYIKFISQKKDRIEDDIYLRPKEVLGKIKTEANEKISDAEVDINEAEETISTTEKDLSDAKKKLDDGFRQYEIEKSNYENKIRQAETSLRNSKDQLEKGQADLEAGKQNLMDSQEEFDKNIGQNKKVLDEKYKELTKAKEEINAKKIEIQNALHKIDEQASEKSKEFLKENVGLDEASEDGLDSKPLSLDQEDFQMKIDQEKAPLLEALKQIENKEAELNAGFDQYNKSKQDFDKAKSDGLAKIQAGQDEIDKNQREINQGWTQYFTGRDELQYNKRNGKNKLEEAYKKLLDSKNEYEKGLREFEANKDKALDEIQDGKAEIKDKKGALLKLRDPEYHVESIFDNQGIDTYYQNSLNMDSLSKVFPVFFYMVAMLVTITTMKRYIQEQRLINGTLKSLGYSNKMIGRRFYIYGLIPTIIGSLIGGILGRFLIVKVIFDAYSTGFEIIETLYINSIFPIIGSIILSSVLVAMTVYLTSKKTIKELPARLLQGQSPESGSKILLEKIPLIWKRLSFMQKITSRNIFRYKSRMFMTIFGVAGCTALIFFGFAMIDSLKDTASIQQHELHNYTAVAILDENSSDKDKKDYNEKIKTYDHLNVKNDSAKLKKDNSEIELSVVIPEDMDKFKDFVSLRKNKKNPIDLDKAGAVLTENASKELSIKANDNINVNIDGKVLEVKIGAISENYVGDYLYLSKDYYKDLSNENLVVNANYVRGDPDDIIEKLENTDSVLAVINTSKSYASMDSLLDNLNLVIVVITLISSVLASVVLYNITDINVSERKRELATIKVLGFYPKEVTSYIYREIFLLTLLGIGFGYILGYLIFRYIIALVAPRNIMLAYKLHPISFIVSAAITLVLSLIILLYIHRKLKKIDMAEAMSSGE